MEDAGVANADIIIPDIVAFIILGVIAGFVLGIILAFLFHMPQFIWAGLFSGVIAGVVTHWLAKRNVQFFSPTAPAQAAPTTGPPAMPTDIEHLVKIFDSWAGHSNFVAACFVGVVAIVAWMAIAITRLHVENPRTVYYHPLPPDSTLPPYQQPPLLEPPKEKYRGNLPVKQS
jgi:hypothetical protein